MNGFRGGRRTCRIGLGPAADPRNAGSELAPSLGIGVAPQASGGRTTAAAITAAAAARRRGGPTGPVNRLETPRSTGKVRFGRQRTGERSYDLNRDGVAHYGLFPDLLAVAQRRPDGGRALRLLFRSAEAYLETWSRAVAKR